MNAYQPGTSDDLSSLSIAAVFIKDWVGSALGSTALWFVWRASRSKADVDLTLKQHSIDIELLKKQVNTVEYSLTDLKISVAKIPTRQEFDMSVESLRRDLKHDIRNIGLIKKTVAD